MTSKTALTKEEQMYWRFVASEKMYKALKVLVDTYWQNQGSDGRTCPRPKQFIACITPKGIPDYWASAKEALALAEGRIE